MKTKTVRYVVQYLASDINRWESDNATFDTLANARKYLKGRDLEICGKRDTFRIVKKVTTFEVVD
jgi:hypothetical protein